MRVCIRTNCFVSHASPAGTKPGASVADPDRPMGCRGFFMSGAVESGENE